MNNQIGSLTTALIIGWVATKPLMVTAADGSVELKFSGSNVLLKVDGDKDDDWRMQTSTNLTTWTTLTNFGVILSGNETNAPWRTVGTKASGPTYYRAVQTEGLYDPSLFRTISITHTQASATVFSNLMHLARQYGTNVYLPALWMDNGATNQHVGARWKGNTSYTMGGLRKSVNLEFDYMVTNADLMSYSTVNLNNAAGDETVMREPLYFGVMNQYTPCPQGAMCQLYVNGSLWSVYSLIQQENGQLINQWFPSNDGDRWRAPNNPNSTASTAFGYLGNTNVSTYLSRYELKTDNATTNVAFGRLINAINVLNNTTTDFRNVVENVFAVDNWLWFLAVENVFADDDSYWNKGADYGFYYEIESGRIHPVEHDGNESFIAGDVALTPLAGVNTTRPLLYKFLSINEIKQRYLAHLRTILAENFNPGVMTSNINAFHALSINAIVADPRKGITMSAYTNDLVALKTWITNRYNNLTVHAELTPLQPNINSVTGPTATVYATNIPTVTANVTSSGSGINSVWLYFRDKPYGRFTVRQMFDDGTHGDGVAGDNVYGAVTTNYPAGNKIHYYIEARANNTAQAARFAPARAENETYDYSVALTTAANTSVVLNEFMASNTSTLADPQGEYDDWIELRNLTGSVINLTGLYLTDEPSNPRKWAFPSGTTIAANGYLLIWADEDGLAESGLHASFKLSGDGEQIYLIDTDANNNQVLDAITFSAQTTDVSYGRTAADADIWSTLTPTPNAANP
jgi:hypothetical protein